MTTTETKVDNLKINRLTKAQYDGITPSSDELYYFTDLSSILDNKVNTSSLATVATSGSYNDLSNKPTIPTVDQTYNALSSNAQSGVAIAGAKFLQNTATGSNGLTVGGTASTVGGATNIGMSSITSKSYSTAVGYNSQAKGNYSTTVGWNAMATKRNAIQIGYGTNTTENSLSIGFYNQSNYQLLDGTTGKIPSDRINIATSVTSSSTNAETVGAKLFYDTCGDIETLINAL